MVKDQPRVRCLIIACLHNVHTLVVLLVAELRELGPVMGHYGRALRACGQRIRVD